MHRRSVHRGIAVLALVTILALAGAPPAAAADLSLLDRVANLWSAVTHGEAGLWDLVAGWFGGTEKAATTTEDDRGAGSDPNGVAVPAQVSVITDDSY
jgi:hypothetical protein